LASRPDLPAAVHRRGRRRSTQRAEVSGAGNVVVQVVGNGNTVHPRYAHLSLTRYLTRRLPAAAGASGDAALLSPYALSVPLLGREEVLADLWCWMRDSGPVSLRVLAAPAGAGKTRLALELCEAAVRERWHAGFLTETELVRFRNQQNLSTWGWNRPTLIVIDYAAARARLLRNWLIELADHPGHEGKPLRLLLLERQADRAGGWWCEAFGVGGGDAEAVERLLDPPSGPYLLPSLAGPAERRAVLTSILERIGSPLRPPAPSASPDFDRRLAELSWGGEPLFLLMAGLVAARAGFAEVLALTAPDLAFRIAGHEIGRIHDLARHRGIPEAFLAHLAAYVTLCQGLTQGDLRATVEEEKGHLGYQLAGDPPEIVQALAAALPGDADSVSPILPDVVGEAVVLETLLVDGRSEQGLSVISRATRRAAERVTASLVRLAQDYGAVRPEPIVWFSEAAAGRLVGLDALTVLLYQLPHSTLILRESAAALTARALALARDAGRQESIAALLNDLSNRLSDLGRWEEALAASEEAGQLYRKFAAVHPDVFRPAMAIALNNLSVVLGDLGRPEEALEAGEEAVLIRRCLAAERPDAFTPALATALANLSGVLGDLGRPEEALKAGEEAVRLLRSLAAEHPDAFRPALSSALDNLSNRLSDLGRRGEALLASEEALRLRRELTAARPDAFRPDLAASLNNLSNRLSDLGRGEEALAASKEAARLYRQLATACPGAFRPELAGSLNNLSNRLSNLGHREEALAVSEEAVPLYRQLATTRPDAFRPELAMALSNLAKVLDDVGRREEALAASAEAAQLFRELAAARPDVFRLALAKALNNLAKVLGDVGGREEALATSEEAAQLFRELAAAHPEAFQPDLASALSNLSNRLSDFGRREEALAASEEAARLFHELAPARPDAFRPELARALNNLSNRLADFGRREEALTAIEEVVAIRRELAAARPDAFQPDLATALHNLSNRLGALGRGDDALAACEEAIRTLSPQFLAHPAAFQDWMRTMIGGYRHHAREAGREPDLAILSPVLALLDP
jgi:tetratricopeptide (TPR) repeat protein